MVFLVAQSLNGSCVEGFDVALPGQVDGEIGDDGLARPGGSGHQDVIAGFEFGQGPPLDLIQVEIQRLFIQVGQVPGS